MVSLPYGFTLFSNSTSLLICKFSFHYLMDLHYSQTLTKTMTSTIGFTTLWIYTILKHLTPPPLGRRCFTTLWIYTILKLSQCIADYIECFTTLWIYTILKHDSSNVFYRPRFHYLMDLHYSQTSNKLRPLYSAGQIHKI